MSDKDYSPMSHQLKMESVPKRLQAKKRGGYSRFSCSSCDRKGMTERELNEHAEQKHGGVKCNQCEKKFKKVAGVRQHIEIGHQGAKHACHLCEKTYSTKAALKIHINMHLGLKPYQCDKCKSTFRGVDSFSKHKRLHNLEVMCQVCGKRLYDESQLESHTKKHTATKASNFTSMERTAAVALARYSKYTKLQRYFSFCSSGCLA